MKLDDEILDGVSKRLGVSKEQAEKVLQKMIEDGELQINDDPSMPFDLKLTTDGAKFAEKMISEEYGEFKKITDHNGISYKVPTIVIIREGVREEDLHHFPLWTDD
jgi:hypothetical protein